MYNTIYRKATNNNSLSSQEKELEAIAERTLTKHAKVLARITAAKKGGTI